MPSGGVLAGSTFLNDPARKIGVRQAVEDFMRNQRGAQILETQDHVPPLEGTPCALDTRIEELRSSHGIQVLSRQCGSCLLSRLHTRVTETVSRAPPASTPCETQSMGTARAVVESLALSALGLKDLLRKQTLAGNSFM